MIRLTKPELSGALDGLGKILEHGFLVQGEQVREFETRVAGYVGRGYGLAVNSGTAAIQCALVGLGIGPGDVVALPDFTFPATANAVVLSGARPMLVDIDPATFNIDPAALEGGLNEQVRAVMPVDLFGLAADMEAIEGICRRRDLIMIEDSACALGAAYGDRKCGSFGDASVFSFHPRKVITTGEGGMVLTDRDEASQKIREFRNHGMRVSGGRAEFVAAGYNFRMTEMEAVLGLAQMPNIGRIIQRRREIAAVYDRLLGTHDSLVTPVEPHGLLHTYQAYVVMVGEGLNRDLVIDLLRKRGVETTIGTYALHVQPYYRELLGHRPGDFPRSLNAMRQSLALPIYPSMTDDEILEVVKALAEALMEASRRK
jgi:perosamine synthetase